MVKARRAARSEGRRASQVQTAEPEPTSFDVIIHTDGACAGNPGPGGWGVVIEDRRGASRGGREFQGHALSATNNQMELMAAIMALEAITTTASIQIHSDSQYVIRGITRWIHKWKAQGWKVQGGGEVKNIGLWQRLDAARQRHKVRWCWVKGHAGNPGNERADTIACAMRDKARRLA
ncbi:ribonuclease HI [Paracoccus sp. IB05]|nr:ribonuclease HI [Paracoccus sp. IB05]MBJ2153987.1 ribonuclease HI [Paracoccus sp. IB05]